jgi:uncharacterized protein
VDHPGLAVVTGASSGIGAAFARDLAARGYRLLLVARRADRLAELASELSGAAGAARWVDCDLSTADGLARCRAAVDEAGEPSVVVLNAGFGTRGAIDQLDRERETAMVRLNVEAVVDMACHVLPAMRRRGSGRMIIVSSAAAWQPLPFMATYGATKAFELHFAEAIRQELRGTGIQVIAVCPGPTRTEFTTVAGEAGLPGWIPQETADGVVRATWRALDRGKAHVATGPLARFTIGCARILPRRLVVRAAGLMGPK